MLNAGVENNTVNNLRRDIKHDECARQVQVIALAIKYKVTHKMLSLHNTLRKIYEGNLLNMRIFYTRILYLLFFIRFF